MAKLRCPPVPDAISVREIEGARFIYDRTHPFIDPFTLRNVRPSLREALSATFCDLKAFGMEVEAVFTAGAYVCKHLTWSRNLRSPHAKGYAIDFDGVMFATGGTVFNRDWEEESVILDRIQAVLRMHFGIVLDWRYNRAHEDHFHCDLSRPVGGAQRSLDVYVQAALNRVHGEELEVDGIVGPMTRDALKRFQQATNLPTTGQRDLTTLKALLLVAAAPGRGEGTDALSEEWTLAVEGVGIPGVTIREGKAYMPVRAGLEALDYGLKVEGRTITATRKASVG